MQGVTPNDTSNLPTSNAFGKSNTASSFSTEVGEKDLNIVVDEIDVTYESFLSLNKKCTNPMQHSGTTSTPSLPKP